MPNWCYTKLEIEGSNNQLKKINKILLSKEAPSFNTIGDIEYDILSVVDYINVRLAINEEEFQKANILATSFGTDIRTVLSTIYKSIRENTFSKINNDCIYHGGIFISDMFVDTINSLLKTYDKIINYKESIPEESTDLSVNIDSYQVYDLNCTNLFPDNPLSFYRHSIIQRCGLVNDSSTNINTAIDDWYMNRILNTIGVKWNPSEVQVDIEDNLLTYSMECAWGPCQVFARLLTELFDVTTTIRYSEGGCNFIGVARYIDGKLVASVV